MADLFSNPRFADFREHLAARGCVLKPLWSGQTGRNPSGKGYDDICLFSVHSSNSNPKHGTVIVQDYGARDGFGLWLDPLTIGHDEGAQEILGGRDA